jgi:hypothetical protein
VCVCGQLHGECLSFCEVSTNLVPLLAVSGDVTYEVHKAVFVKITVSRGVTPCNLVDGYCHSTSKKILMFIMFRLFDI